MSERALEITRDEWHPFFDAFSGLHRGRLVTLEVRGGEQKGAEPMALPAVAEEVASDVRASEVPLEEIAAEGGDRISIVLRPTSSDEISHVVEGPLHVWLRQSDDRSDASLEIQSSAGTTTLLRVRGTALPRPPAGAFS